MSSSSVAGYITDHIKWQPQLPREPPEVEWPQLQHCATTQVRSNLTRDGQGQPWQRNHNTTMQVSEEWFMAECRVATSCSAKVVQVLIDLEMFEMWIWMWFWLCYHSTTRCLLRVILWRAQNLYDNDFHEWQYQQKGWYVGEKKCKTDACVKSWIAIDIYYVYWGK